MVDVEKNFSEFKDQMVKFNNFMFGEGFNSINEFQKGLFEKQAELMSNVVQNMKSYADMFNKQFANSSK